MVADSFENARAAAKLIRIDYQREPGHFDLSQQVGRAPPKGASSGEGSSSSRSTASATSRPPSPPPR